MPALPLACAPAASRSAYRHDDATLDRAGAAFALVILLSVSAACRTEQGDWKRISSSGSATDYEEYLERYPAATNRVEAEQALVRIETQAAQVDPSSPRAAAAVRRIESLLGARSGPEALAFLEAVHEAAPDLVVVDRLRRIRALREGARHDTGGETALPGLWCETSFVEQAASADLAVACARDRFRAGDAGGARLLVERAQQLRPADSAIAGSLGVLAQPAPADRFDLEAVIAGEIQPVEGPYGWILPMPTTKVTGRLVSAVGEVRHEAVVAGHSRFVDPKGQPTGWGVTISSGTVVVGAAIWHAYAASLSAPLPATVRATPLDYFDRHVRVDVAVSSGAGLVVPVQTHAETALPPIGEGSLFYLAREADSPLSGLPADVTFRSGGTTLELHGRLYLATPACPPAGLQIARAGRFLRNASCLRFVVTRRSVITGRRLDPAPGSPIAAASGSTPPPG
jgi:hypothetical protein